MCLAQFASQVPPSSTVPMPQAQTPHSALAAIHESSIAAMGDDLSLVRHLARRWRLHPKPILRADCAVGADALYRGHRPANESTATAESGRGILLGVVWRSPSFGRIKCAGGCPPPSHRGLNKLAGFLTYSGPCRRSALTHLRAYRRGIERGERYVAWVGSEPQSCPFPNCALSPAGVPGSI